MADDVQVVDDLQAAIDEIIDAGGRLGTIGPADSPRHATVTDANGVQVRLRLAGAEPAPLPLDPPFTVSRASGAGFGAGRAGMSYRDLLPGRAGGSVIASHIRIENGGEVPDYVHSHEIAFQLIFCASGWVEVVYEDQGEPFRLERGDAVLQANGIAHQVLRCSAGLEVVEISAPAEHETTARHDVGLPTPIVRSDRVFGGQTFVRHVAAEVAPITDGSGFDRRSLGLGGPSAGAGDAHVLLASAADVTADYVADEHLRVVYVLDGTGSACADDGPRTALGPSDACITLAGVALTVESAEPGFEVLVVEVRVGQSGPNGSVAGR